MFEQATRLKLRFLTSGGVLSAEDMWDLPLTGPTTGKNLNDIAKSLSKEVKADAEEDFIKLKTSEDKELALRFDIVKHIIGVRLAEREAEVDKEAVKAKRQQILGILADKEAEELMGKTPEELKAMLDES